MKTQTMIAIFFIMTVLGTITGIAYSVVEHDAGAAAGSIIAGLFVGTMCVVINDELERG